MELPRPGQAIDTLGEQQCSSYIDGLVFESMERRRLFEPDADANLNMYLGRQWDGEYPRAMMRVTMNRIQNAVLSSVSVLTANTPRINFTPRESMEPPIYYINLHNIPMNPAIQALVDSLPQETIKSTDLPDGTNVPPRPLTSEEIQMVQSQIFEGNQTTQAIEAGQLSPEAGATVVPPEVLAAVTDESTADAVQTIFDAEWSECNADYYINENFLNNAIIGWQFMLYEWDDALEKHMLRNPEFLQIHMDPVATDVGDARFAVYDQVLSEDQAVALYPRIAEAIRRAASEGIPRQPGDYAYRQSSIYLELTFRRKMVIVRTAWIRDQPYPMSIADALSSGQVKQGTAVIETVVEDEEGNKSAGEPQAIPIFLLPDGRETFQNSPTWPVRMGIRQMRVIAGRVVEDRECEFRDIPLPQNVNIPVPFCPYGQGEPYRLGGMQQSINAILSDLVMYYNHNSMPLQYVAESINKSLPQLAQGAYTSHAYKFVVPDDLLKELQGQLMGFIAPPQMPAEAWQLLQMLIKLVDQESNNSEVMQGKAAAGWSGEAINLLQKAAAGVIGLKSRRAERMLLYLARLMTHSIIHRTSLKRWSEYVAKYPPYILIALRERAKTIYSGLVLTVTSGRQAAQAQEKNTALRAYQMNLLSPQTTLHRLGENPQVEIHNWMLWKREMGASQPSSPDNPVPGQSEADNPQPQQ